MIQIRLLETNTTRKPMYYWAIELPSGKTFYYTAYDNKDHFAGDEENNSIIPLLKVSAEPQPSSRIVRGLKRPLYPKKPNYGTIEDLAQELITAQKDKTTVPVHTVAPNYETILAEVLNKGTLNGKPFCEACAENPNNTLYSPHLTHRKLTTDEQLQLREIQGIWPIRVIECLV